MVSLLAVAGLAVILLVNTAVAALLTRFLRVRLKTRWGSLVYALLACPFVLVVLTLFLSGVLNLGPDLGSAAVVVGLVIVLPTATGITFDYFWMPAPGEVELPEKYEDDRDRGDRRIWP
ncbi:MAG: hypothetical protein ABEJ40_01585 [Haloarculaceae archaeon]